ncbi:MAG: hypothetical protein N3E49_06360 [Bacteroidia bacterium]|nr:hypothetical protein [Bacteroidia bacterium]
MRLFLYVIAGTAAILLWFLIKLDKLYTLNHTVFVRGSPLGDGAFVGVEVTGKGYNLLRWRHLDTISAVQLCVAPPTTVGEVKLHWNMENLSRLGVCGKLQVRRYRPSLRWILPSGADFVVPPTWIADSVWTFIDSLPRWDYQLAAEVGRRTYPIPLPRHWGVYPETLWVEANVARFIYAITEVTPQPEGTKGYTLILNPSRVQVRFWVPQSMVDRWKPSDFYVVVDMQKVLPKDSVVYPEVRRRPPYVRQVEIFPPALKFTRLY